MGWCWGEGQQESRHPQCEAGAVELCHLRLHRHSYRHHPVSFVRLRETCQMIGPEPRHVVPKVQNKSQSFSPRVT